MDKFDDLPEDIEKDDKPKFVTQVSDPATSNQQVSNGLMPLFEEDDTVASHGQFQAEVENVVADHKFVAEADKDQEHADEDGEQ